MDPEKILDRIAVMLGEDQAEAAPAEAAPAAEAKTKLQMGAVKVSLETATTEEGTITLESDNFEVNDPVFIVSDEQRIPLPPASYKLDDGRTITVNESGVITAIKEAGAEEEAPAAAEAEQELDNTGATAAAKKVIETEQRIKETLFSKEDFEGLQNKVTLMLAQVKELETKLNSVEEIKASAEAVNVELTTENAALKKAMDTEEAPRTTHTPEAKKENLNISLGTERQGPVRPVDRALAHINN